MNQLLIRNYEIGIIILIIFTNNLLAQDFEQTSHTFFLNGQNTTLSGDMPFFQQNKFLLGWQWRGCL